MKCASLVPSTRSRDSPSSIDLQDISGYIPGIVRCQENGGIGNILWLGRSSKKNYEVNNQKP